MNNTDKIPCEKCAYFSDRIGRAYVGCTLYVEAMCLNNQSPYYTQYMRENSTCPVAVRGPAVDAYDGEI